jgi:RNA polymerase sigma factor (sigma-70 family)
MTVPQPADEGRSAPDGTLKTERKTQPLPDLDTYDVPSLERRRDPVTRLDIIIASSAGLSPPASIAGEQWPQTDEVPALTPSDIASLLNRADPEALRALSKEEIDQLEEVYARYAPALYRYVQTITGDYDETQDVVQLTFVKAFVRWPRLKDIEPGYLHNWLYKVATNTARDVLRRLKRQLAFKKKYQAQEIHGTTEQNQWQNMVVEADETACLVQEALKVLSRRQRACLHLYVVEELSGAEVASMLKIKPNSVTGYISRAKKKFRKEYERLASLACERS